MAEAAHAPLRFPRQAVDNRTRTLHAVLDAISQTCGKRRFNQRGAAQAGNRQRGFGGLPLRGRAGLCVIQAGWCCVSSG